MPLARYDLSGEPDTLGSIVLDLDSDGRLLGIEITAGADTVLRPELLADA